MRIGLRTIGTVVATGVFTTVCARTPTLPDSSVVSDAARLSWDDVPFVLPVDAHAMSPRDVRIVVARATRSRMIPWITTSSA